MRFLVFVLAALSPMFVFGQTASSTNPTTNVSQSGQQIANVEGTPNVAPQVVNTALGTQVTAPGIVTVTPGSMTGIAPGTELIVGSGASQELITVSSTSPPDKPAQFLALFTKPHAGTDSLVGRPSDLTSIDAEGNLTFGTTEQLLESTVCKSPQPPGVADCNLDANDTYAIIHVLAWGPSATDGSNDIKSIRSTNWYVYRKHGNAWIGYWNQADFSGNSRLYGAATIVFLYVELNASIDLCDPYQVRYQLTISKRVPTNVQAVQQLAQIIVPSDAGAAKRAAKAVPGGATCPTIIHTNVWGGKVLKIGYKTSDIKIDSYQLTKANGPMSARVSTPLSASLPLINEKKQWWDVSVAVPVKSVNALQYVSSNDTVVPTKIAKQNLFAIADFYLPPIDLAGTTYSMIPHPIAGVSMASQPLHSFIVGGAIGLHFAEVFVASDWVKQQSLTGLSSGSPATQQQLSAATSYKYKAQFVVGINLPVKAAYSALQKTTK